MQLIDPKEVNESEEITNECQESSAYRNDNDDFKLDEKNIRKKKKRKKLLAGIKHSSKRIIDTIEKTRKLIG
jgi:hypothetical protein